MGLWQNLVAGYDENRQNLLLTFPLSTTTISNNDNDIVVVILSPEGRFKDCYSIKKYNKNRDEKIKEFVIPVSEKSLGRSGTSPDAHPVFDQFKYLCGRFEDFCDEDRKKLDELEKKKKEISKKDKAEIEREIEKLKRKKTFSDEKLEEKRKGYLDRLDAFISSEYARSVKTLKSVFDYMKNCTLAKDLEDRKCFPEEKSYVFFAVEYPGNPTNKLWEDSQLFEAWHSFYVNEIKDNGIDYINGGVASITDMHPKKVIAAAGNAKLISSNDTKNFTFRGLFARASQAVSIGYESSQKAHQFLRYLISSNGILCGEQVIVPFTIQSQGKFHPNPPVKDSDLDWDDDEVETMSDKALQLCAEVGIDYAKSIRKALTGYNRDNQWKSHARSAILVLESATPGRLSITFYREFLSSEYLEKIQTWHEACKWPLWRKKGETAQLYFGAPSVDRIIQAAFGWPKPGQDKAYEKIRMRARQNLIRTILDNAPIPRDYLENAIRLVSNPLAITESNGKFDRRRFNSALATTCAILKHETNNQKESFDMSIDLNRTDRDYLYGRLLGAADKLEQYALRKKNNDRLVTAAIRHMQTFSQRPFSVWEIIHQSLLPYKQQVRGCIADKEIQSIHDMFMGCEKEFENDSPLSGLYLVGYYHECAYIDERVREAYAKSSDNNQPKEN